MVRALVYHYTDETVLINGEEHKTGKRVRIIIGQMKIVSDWILSAWDERGKYLKNNEHFDLVEHREEPVKQPKLFAGI